MQRGSLFLFSRAFLESLEKSQNGEDLIQSGVTQGVQLHHEVLVQDGLYLVIVLLVGVHQTLQEGLEGV